MMAARQPSVSQPSALARVKDPFFSMTLSALWRSIWSRAWLVLGFMAFVSGANGAAARLATGEVPPLLLVFLRWAIVCASLSVILKREQWLELRGLLRTSWFAFAWMGLLGYSGFNALFYVAAYHTSGVNLTLLQSAIPALVLVGAAIAFRLPIRAVQVAGMVLTFAGVLIVAAKGDLGRLSSLAFDRGDVMVLIACLFYAFYTLGLRARPPGTPLVFFAGMAFAALLWSVPIAGYEIVAGQAYWPSREGWLITLFIAFAPSFAGQLCYMRGVDLIGPARAGLFANLIPIFGALSAVVVLGETFLPAHAVAVALGLVGIALAEWPKGRSIVPRRARRSARRPLESGAAARDAPLP